MTASFTTVAGAPTAVRTGRDGLGGTTPDAQTFVDPAALDFHLRADAPGLDSAQPGPLAPGAAVDDDGAPRVSGFAADAGAFEFVDHPPTASFTVSRTSAAQGLGFTFDASAWADPDPGGRIVQHLWSFGDGSPEASTPTPNAMHWHADMGHPVVTLRTVDQQWSPSPTSAPVALTVTDGIAPDASATAPRDGARLHRYRTVKRHGHRRRVVNVQRFAGRCVFTATCASHPPFVRATLEGGTWSAHTPAAHALPAGRWVPAAGLGADHARHRSRGALVVDRPGLHPEVMDPEEERAASRERWESIAPGWESGAEAFHAGALPVAHWMVDQLEPQPGQTILELAAGRGDVGFLAAELLHPGGKLISSDGAEAMVALARRRAAALGIENVEFKPIDLEWIDAKLATIDGLLCRFGYMHAVDPEHALREARRVLRPGGKAVIAIWAAPQDNPWLSLLTDAAEELGLAEPKAAGEPGAFALSAPGKIEELLEDAGFDTPTVEPLDLTFTAPTVDAWWETQRAMSSSMGPLIASLSPAEHYKLRDAAEARWAPYVATDGSIALPGRALGVVAEA